MHTRDSSMRKVAILVEVALLLGGAACGDDEWQTLRSEHFNYHFHPGDPDVCPEITSLFEEHFAVIHTAAEMSTAGPTVDYWKLRDTAELLASGSCLPVADGCAPGTAIASHRAAHFHELIHTYLYRAAAAYVPSFLNEGLAQVLACGHWSVESGAGDVTAVGLPELLSWSPGADAERDQLDYYASAALTSHLIHRFGLPHVVDFAIESARGAEPLSSLSYRYFGAHLDELWPEAVAGPIASGSCLPLYECAVSPALSLNGEAREGLARCGMPPSASFQVANAAVVAIQTVGCADLEVLSCDGGLAERRSRWSASWWTRSTASRWSSPARSRRAVPSRSPGTRAYPRSSSSRSRG
jgi:hypothetical protein